MDRNIQIITVVNDLEIFNSIIKKNNNMNCYNMHIFDNTLENLGISARYNNFIDNYMKDKAWLIFCHQDFGFLEDPYNKLRDLDKNFIYGTIGAINRKGLFIKSGKINLCRKKLLGQINQSNDARNFYKNGKYLSRPKIVDTVDCCCLIVYSSLIKRYNLRFDEKLKFHLYSEDFSLNARYNYRIKTKVVQIECKHLSLGNASKQFYDCLKYLKSKYNNNKFAGTCFD